MPDALARVATAGGDDGARTIARAGGAPAASAARRLPADSDVPAAGTAAAAIVDC